MTNIEKMKYKESKLSHKRLLELLEYNPITGAFINKVNRVRAIMGTVAGQTGRSGYVVVGIDGIRYNIHRLAWFYTYKKWPENEIDHINRIKDDNRICNLREATHSENMSNRKPPSGGQIGARGISWDKSNNIWRVTYKNKYLGYAKTIEEGLQFQKEKSEGAFVKKRERNRFAQQGNKSKIGAK